MACRCSSVRAWLRRSVPQVSATPSEPRARPSTPSAPPRAVQGNGREGPVAESGSATTGEEDRTLEARRSGRPSAQSRRVARTTDWPPGDAAASLRLPECGAAEMKRECTPVGSQSLYHPGRSFGRQDAGVHLVSPECLVAIRQPPQSWLKSLQPTSDPVLAWRAKAGGIN
jgi:hypothetical protein